jgi:hypothetical protein
MGGIVLGILVWQEGGEAVGAVLAIGAIALAGLVYWLVRRKREGKPSLIDPDLSSSKVFRLGIFVIRWGFAFLTTGMVVLVPIVPRADSGWALVVPLVIAGVGLGLLVSRLNNYTLAPISEERVSEAAGEPRARLGSPAKAASNRWPWAELRSTRDRQRARHAAAALHQRTPTRRRGAARPPAGGRRRTSGRRFALPRSVRSPADLRRLRAKHPRGRDGRRGVRPW